MPSPAASPPEQPTLRGLLRHPELHLALLSSERELPAGALDRPLRWVHSSDLLDPAPFLADDLVLLTTGTQFAQRAAAQQIDYVARLARRGVVGLGFARDVALPEVPAAVRSACRNEGIPLFEVPYQTPFIAIARVHAEEIAAQRSLRQERLRARERRLHATLLASLLRGDAGLAAQLRDSLPDEPIIVAVAALDAPREELDDRWGPEVFAGDTDAGYTLCLPADHEQLLHEAAAHFAIRFGVSTPAVYRDFPRAHAEATDALRRGGAAVTRFADAAATGVLRALGTDEAQAAASAFLAPLRETPLATTLRVWLAHDGRLEAAAAELGIHRHTLRTRIAQSARLLNRDLSAFPARAELWAALQAAGDSSGR